MGSFTIIQTYLGKSFNFSPKKKEKGKYTQTFRGSEENVTIMQWF